MPTLTLLGDLTQVKRILQTYNILVSQDDLLLGKSRDRASAKIAGIYTEAEATLPSVKADDEQAWELFNYCIAEEYRMRLVKTAEEANLVMMALTMAYDDIKLHLGIVVGADGTDGTLIPTPTAKTGPTIDSVE